MSNFKQDCLVNNPNDLDKLTHEDRYPPRPKILDNVLQAVGHTPLVRLNKVPQSLGVKCEILVKCEFFNPGGSIKDRIALRMINDAVKLGRLKEGGIMVEPSSGNTAIALGLVSALRGYDCTVTIPEKNEGEKLTLMKALGLKMITTKAVPWDSPESYLSIAHRMSEEKGGVTLDQYSVISNALANYDQTGEEILEDCDNKLDVLVACTGTGGTITGISAKLKERCPNVHVVGVDPIGSVIARPESLNQGLSEYKVEGVGHDFVPKTCVLKMIDSFVKSNDKDSFAMARRLVKEEGLLIGGSSGSAVYGAIKYALDNNLDETKRIVVILPDSVRNYMTKYLSDDWMVDWEFLPLEHYLDEKHKLYGKTVKDLKLKTTKVYTEKVTIEEALSTISEGANAIVLEKDGKLSKLVSEAELLPLLYEKGLKGSDSVSEAKAKRLVTVEQTTDLSIVAKLLERHTLVAVRREKEQLEKGECYKITTSDLIRLKL